MTVAQHERIVASLTRSAQTAPQGKFRMGDLVKKSTGSEWEGRVVGWYSTEQTKEGYAVESSAHRNSVQIYPAKALEAVE
ncbi:DfrB family trimethoprim-resistant dihydrofolate reductase [Stutzerimonas stutzeri]|nr:DfrB family trimethoprim-resistant dihydrofolate reductase [Stutzerimonas stutzeri]